MAHIAECFPAGEHLETLAWIGGNRITGVRMVPLEQPQDPKDAIAKARTLARGLGRHVQTFSVLVLRVPETTAPDRAETIYETGRDDYPEFDPA